MERVEAHLAAITILKLQEKCCHEKSKKVIKEGITTECTSESTRPTGILKRLQIKGSNISYELQILKMQGAYLSWTLPLSSPSVTVTVRVLLRLKFLL